MERKGDKVEEEGLERGTRLILTNLPANYRHFTNLTIRIALATFCPNKFFIIRTVYHVLHFYLSFFPLSRSQTSIHITVLGGDGFFNFSMLPVRLLKIADSMRI